MKYLQTLLIALILSALSGFGGQALAARVEDLYSAEVPLPGAADGLQTAFRNGLREVLVKVTGRRAIVADAAVVEQFGAAATLVQQYRITPDGTVWILFDEVALRRGLDAVSEPIWGTERPATLVWLVVDSGFGTREIVAGVAESTGQPGSDTSGPTDGSSQLAAVRDALLAAADGRGLPIILPVVDTQELLSITLDDVWGGYTESLVGASRRYPADAVLVGRARPAAGGEFDVSWSLLLDDERFDWDGDVPGGPNDLADFFAARLSAFSGEARAIRLSVDGVDDLDAYGRLSEYLAALDLIDEFAVEQVTDGRVVFSLQVRGDADRLMRSIALRRVLQPVDEPLQSPPDRRFGDGAGRLNLHYRLIAGP